MEDSVSRTSKDMQRSDSVEPEMVPRLQVGDEFVGNFESLVLSNDHIHPLIHGSAADGGESSKNVVMSRSLTTQTTSAPTTRRLLEFTGANSVVYENIGGSRGSGSKGKEVICENSYCVRTTYFNDEGSSSDCLGGHSFPFNNVRPVFGEQSRYPTNGIKINEPNYGRNNISKNLGVIGRSTRKVEMDSLEESQPDIGHAETRNTDDIGNPLSSKDPILELPRNPMGGIQIHGLPTRYGHHTMNFPWDQNATQSSSPQHDVLQAGSQETWGNYNQRPARRRPLISFSQLRGSFLELMITNDRDSPFDQLLEECGDEQLESLVQELLLQNADRFIDAAFIKEGSTSINKLIKRIKKTNHAYTLTELLSLRLYDLMTDVTAKTVITHCLNQFGSRPNEVLYETVMANVCDLAIHEVGCISLNECISTISGQQKLALLGIIASNAVFLSNDRFGNYVVQHAMLLGDKVVAPYILHRLRGHFIQLSQEKWASNVVERCVESSRLGTCVVVTEILQTPSTPYRLARHPFGNYIIQVALKHLKKHQIETLYFHLVEALTPHFRRLQSNAGGRKILDLISSGFEIQHQGWPEF